MSRAKRIISWSPPDDAAVVGNGADAVGIAVKGETPRSAPSRATRGDQVLEIGRNRRVREMIGKVAVEIAVEFHYLAAQLPEESGATLPPTPLPASTTTFSGRSTLML